MTYFSFINFLETGFKRRTGPVFSESSRTSSRIDSGHPKATKEKEEKEIPHYDFDKVETASEAVDIDKVSLLNFCYRDLFYLSFHARLIFFSTNGVSAR